MRLRTMLSKARLRTRDVFTRSRGAITSPRRQSTSDNVFHCCLHKTGSQWVKRILGDPDVFRLTGLRTHEYQSAFPEGHDPRPVDERSFTDPFPLRTIVSPLYIDYVNYRDIPKPTTARAFFVTRDPRDIIVSWYFSQKYSHGLMGDMEEVRKNLSHLPEPEGLIYAIQHLDRFGVFRAQRSWLAAADDESVIVVKFEDLIGEDSLKWYSAVFDHCWLEVDTDTLRSVLDRYSFERLSGRRQGTEDVLTHFRKGVAGDWRNHFDNRVVREFDSTVGDLVSVLGYES